MKNVRKYGMQIMRKVFFSFIKITKKGHNTQKKLSVEVQIDEKLFVAVNILFEKRKHFNQENSRLFLNIFSSLISTTNSV